MCVSKRRLKKSHGHAIRYRAFAAKWTFDTRRFEIIDGVKYYYSSNGNVSGKVTAGGFVPEVGDLSICTEEPVDSELLKIKSDPHLHH